MKFLRRKDVADRLGYHPKYLDEIETTDPTFPRRFRIGGRAVAWLEDEIEAWMADRIKTRVTLKPREVA